MKVGEMQGNAPVGTTMAIMERGTKVMSAIHKRLHYSQKIEFKLLAGYLLWMCLCIHIKCRSTTRNQTSRF